MCLGSSPSIPAPEPVTPPQETKTPDTIQASQAARKARQAAGGMAGGATGAGTLLTGPSGIAAGALNVAKPSLLGQ